MTRSSALARVAFVVVVLSMAQCKRSAPAPRGAVPAQTESSTMTLPGAQPYPQSLADELASALAAKGPDYVPRTHHKTDSGTPKYINRLIFETSPYLLQHAHNPVNWFPWGKEAFDLASKLGRPILLSVGYSTCHWCHVMEKESFEDEEIASFINSNYIAIKVDREERPDVDAVYMSAVQLFAGRGGWPMTVLMTPERQPFFGGTYFPPRDGVRGSRTGFLTILKKLRTIYDTEKEQVALQAQRLSEAMLEAAQPQAAPGIPGAAAIELAAQSFATRFDGTWGGFGRAPKFPRPSSYELLLRHWRRTKNHRSLEMVTLSLDKMCNGGIYDHIGGGFHRYSTDRQWLVPHFEKMLYDNAQLVNLLVETYQATNDPRWAAVARDTLDYVAKEMTSDAGGFYSATDADSEGHEGTFFVWTKPQIEEILGKERAKIAHHYYGTSDAGNFEGKNILHRQTPRMDIISALGTNSEALSEAVSSIRSDIYEARKKRIPPLLDDKVITEWNGQMISAFARASWALDEPKYLERAIAAAKFIETHLVKEGRLLRTYRAGQAKHGAVLEDYAFFVAGLIDVFEVGGDRRWLQLAIELQKTLDTHYLDERAGGYFTTAKDGEELLIREKPTYDGAQPAGNSVAGLNLLRLHELTLDDNYRKRAERLLTGLSAALTGRQIIGSPKLAQALDWYHDRPKQIIVVLGDDDPKPMQDELRRSFLPNRIIVTKKSGDTSWDKLIPLSKDKVAKDAKTTVYVCTAQVCLKPAQDPDTLRAQLAQVEPLEAKPKPAK